MFSVLRDAWLTFTVCLLIGAFVFIDTLSYPIVRTQGFGHGPAFYPRILAGVLIALGLAFLYQGLRRRRTDREGAAEQKAPAAELTYRPVVLFMALCVASVLSMRYLGFLVSAFLLAFLSTLMIRASFKAPHVALGLLYSAAMITLVYVVFSVFVGVQLPGSALFR